MWNFEGSFKFGAKDRFVGSRLVEIEKEQIIHVLIEKFFRKLNESELNWNFNSINFLKTRNKDFGNLSVMQFVAICNRKF